MRFLPLLCLAAASTSALIADNIVYDNTSQLSPTPQADPIMINQGISPLYDSFAAAASGQITGLRLVLSLCVSGGNPCFTQDFTSGSFQVGLYADVAGVSGNSHMPGAEIALLATVSDSTLSTTPAIYNIPLAASPALSANTTYWIGLSGTTTDAEWSWTTNAGGTGVAAEFFDNPVGVNLNSCGLTTSGCGPYLMSVTTSGGATAQTITFPALTNVSPSTPPFNISATASSNLAVSFASNTPTVCAVSGNTVTILISGGCSITATQAGNATYAAAAPVTQDFTVLFNDISPTASYAAAVDLFAQYGITAGCGNDDFCANGSVTRAEMAVFIITGIFRGSDFSYSTTPHFADVQPGDFGFKWIQAMYELGITAGCGGGNYCPNQSVTREEMAVFIMVARYGTGASFSYSSTPDFNDVPDSGATANYFKFVQRMDQDGITAGCAKAVAPATLPTFCPDEAVTRADMAVFMMAGLFNQFLPAGTPLITGISPSVLGVGTSGTFTITGVNTNFVQGTTTISPIPGVTIGTVTVNSATSLTVQLTAAADATPRPYTIVAITNSEQDVLPNSLTVQ